jgi:hypothetical protein
MQKKCEREGCERKAEYGVCLNIPAKGFGIDIHTPLQVIIGLCVCHKHLLQIRAEPKQVIDIAASDDLRKAIEEMVRAQGKADPDYERAFISGLRFDDPQWRAFLDRRNEARRPISSAPQS